jgi:hypothetical protein
MEFHWKKKGKEKKEGRSMDSSMFSGGYVYHAGFLALPSRTSRVDIISIVRVLLVYPWTWT